jgi:hypothetical protein
MTAEGPLGLRKLNLMGKAHIGKEYSHGYVMTDLDDTRYVAFRLKGAAKYCSVCRKLVFAAEKLRKQGVLTIDQFNEMVWLLDHREEDAFGHGSFHP